ADDSPRTDDPIFDVILINDKVSPTVLTHVGFEPLRAWTLVKAGGRPFAGKIPRVDGYELSVADFIPGVPQYLLLADPVYLAPSAPYRFKLRLSHYLKYVPGNDSELRLVVVVDDNEHKSPHLSLSH